MTRKNTQTSMTRPDTSGENGVVSSRTLAIVQVAIQEVDRRCSSANSQALSDKPARYPFCLPLISPGIRQCRRLRNLNHLASREWLVHPSTRVEVRLSALNDGSKRQGE